MITNKELLERIQTLEKGFSVLSRHLEELEGWKTAHELKTVAEKEIPSLQEQINALPKMPPDYKFPDTLPNGMKLLRVNCMTCGQEVQPNTFHVCPPRPLPPTV